uniref:Ig-like domain-containing protein n=1 Tax=Calidris pygmaea TaxID=425635 RepID=A0A8C3KQC6_9CHAR
MEHFCPTIDHGLFFLTAAVTGQVALEQHVRELTTLEGTGVTFQCSMSGDDMSDYFMYWYRQGPGGSLEWIYQEGDAYGEGFQVKGRATVSRDNSRSESSLSLHRLRLQDSARYFCAVGTETGNAAELEQKPACYQPSG